MGVSAMEGFMFGWLKNNKTMLYTQACYKHQRKNKKNRRL